MKKIKIYSATKGKKEDTPLYRSLNNISKDYGPIPPFDYYFEENNKQSLQKVYNDFLADARHNSIDIAAFIHDDVHINCWDFSHRLKNLTKDYTVFGLAGAVTCKVQEPALWHLMSERENLRGNVAHGTPEQYYYTSFGPLPSRALVIDGVFMGININQLPVDIKFDENYPSKFHYYDLDFSLECNKRGIKVGVVDIPIIHNSPGLTDPNKEYYKGQEYFINKWKQ